MEQVTNINQVKADLAGDLIVQLSIMTQMAEILAEHYHRTGKALAVHSGEYADCSNTICIANRQKTATARQMLSQGV